jgi:Ca2+-binding EF-hand superfamily protein
MSISNLSSLMGHSTESTACAKYGHEEIRKAFGFFDKDNNGFIDASVGFF